MKKLLVVSLMVLSASSVVIAAGDVAAGKEKAVACGACHGADGNSAAPTFPKLAGQGEKYLIKQMNDIKSGARAVPAMAGQLDAMTEQDIANIAAYFSSQNKTLNQANPDLAKVGAKIYRGGIASKGVAACTGCHSPTGGGNALAKYPALGGQHSDYTIAQLKAFRDEADSDVNGDGKAGRRNDGDDSRTMRNIAANLTDREIEALAAYISGLH
jgi:cytochrome c553